MLKSINQGVCKKNKKQYEQLKIQKEKLVEEKKEKEKAYFQNLKIKVSSIKKVEPEKDKETFTEKNKNSKQMKISEDTLNMILSPEKQKSYLNSKNLIEKYKYFCDDLERQEKEYLKKIKEEKKNLKYRSGSMGRLKVVNKKNNKEYRNKSSYKVRDNDKKFESYVANFDVKFQGEKNYQTEKNEIKDIKIDNNL